MSGMHPTHGDKTIVASPCAGKRDEFIVRRNGRDVCDPTRCQYICKMVLFLRLYDLAGCRITAPRIRLRGRLQAQHG